MTFGVRPTPLTTYFTELDAGRFDVVLATIAESCIYMRPALSTAPGQATGLITYNGKAAVRRFLDERGTLPITHHLSVSAREGLQCFVTGTATHHKDLHASQSLFMAHAVLDTDGLISRFLAMSAPLDTLAPRAEV